MIEAELREYSEALARQPRWLVLNKIDTVEESGRAEVVAAWRARLGWGGEVRVISAVTGEGVAELGRAVMAYFDSLEEEDSSAAGQ